MKEEFKTYLEDIGMKETLRKRVEQIINQYHLLLDVDLTDIFVSEYINNEDERQYENLFLFDDTRAMEAKKFIHEDDFDVTYIKDSILYLNWKKSDFDLDNATSQSRININSLTNKDVQIIAKASKNNCEKLVYIMKKYLVSNLMNEVG